MKGGRWFEGIALVTTSSWSTSSFVDETTGLGGGVSGVTLSVLEAAENVPSGAVALSVTESSKLYVLPVESVLLGMLHVTVFPASCPEPVFAAHCVVGEYPPPLAEMYQVYA